MTNQQILEKAIQKAIEGGWKAEMIGMVTLIPAGWMQHDHYKAIIFNHDFAKALWTDAIAQFQVGVSGDTIHLNNIQNWKGHLANMAVAEDPVKYLGDNI